jgi:hypothetical protein
MIAKLVICACSGKEKGSISLIFKYFFFVSKQEKRLSEESRMREWAA